MCIKTDKWLLLILILYFALAINYTLNVPIFEAPDEPDHFAHVQYLVNHNRLPLLIEKEPDAPRTAIHPPLYYFLNALIYAPLQVFDHPVQTTYNEKFGLINRNRYFHRNESIAEHFPFYIIRLFSIFLGMGTIIFGWKIAGECFGKNYYLIILSTALIAFIPQFIYISGTVNCDNLANFISTVIFWLLIKSAKTKGAKRKDIVLMGILLGLASITKFTVLFLIPFAVVIFYIIKNDKNEFYKNILIIFVFIGITSGWYYLRNYLIYDHALGGSFVIKRSLFSSYFIKPFANIMLLSFFGLFGWMNILMDKIIYYFYILFYGIGFLAALKYRKVKICNWILFLGILFSLMSNIRYNMTNDDYQGRHMLAIVAPFAILVVQGYYNIYIWSKEKYHIFLSKKAKAMIVLSIIIVLVSLNIFIVNAYIRPSFARSGQKMNHRGHREKLKISLCSQRKFPSKDIINRIISVVKTDNLEYTDSLLFNGFSVFSVVDWVFI
ncbi:MAG: DUF2142 domain-containing protein [bacterium]